MRDLAHDGASGKGGRGATVSFWLAVVLVGASSLHFLGGQAADPDLWQHLRFGDLIRGDGTLPRHDTFSYTAHGAPLVDHEWLAQWVIAALFAAGGSAALVWLKLALAGMLVFLLLDAAATLLGELPAVGRCHPLTAAVALILVLAVISPGATFRPQLFTILLLAAQSALLARADRRLRSGGARGARISWELALQPVLLLVWANLHGGFIVGVGMLGVYAAATVLRGVLPARSATADRPSRGEVAAVVAIAALGALAPLVNPYGGELYAFLGRTLRMHDAISEWYPVPLLDTGFLRFKLLVLATAEGLFLLWRALRATPAGTSILGWRAVFLGLAALYAFRHQRHTVLFAVAAAPVVIAAAEQGRLDLLARWPGLRPRRPVFLAVAVGACLVAAVQVAGWARTVAAQGMAIRYGRLDFPADAVEFLRAHGIAGNVAMPFEWGAYAIWKLAPQARVFIDGRFETVYPERVINDYFAFMNGSPGWERLLDDYPTEVVVVQRWRDIHPRLFARSDLVYVYSDPAALVFVKPTATNRAALERLASLADRTRFAPSETVFP